MKYKVGDKVLLPRRGNYNKKYDRDIWGVIKEVRKGRLISYKIGNNRHLEDILRDIGGNILYSKDFNNN